MKLSSQLVLTFLLNAFWQVALIVVFASLGSWLLRNSVARYRHWVWATALCLAFLVPAFTSVRTLIDNVTPANTPATFERVSISRFANEAVPPLPETNSSALASTFKINQTLGLTILGIYFAFLLYSIFKLIQAWQTTRSIRRRATEVEPNGSVAEVIHRCELEFGTRTGSATRSVSVFRSETLPVPVTVGIFNPVIILPESLLRDGSLELLTSAIGHEFIHVARRDYLLNLVYELLFVPVSFHPAAALLRRRVRETRELCCDELVAERILNAEVYARSLVKLASPAPPLRRLSVTTTVGIADADILEARIMSLLKKPNFQTRWKKTLLIAVSLLLLVPCAAAAAFAMRFDVAQEPQDKTLTQQDKEKLETMKRRAESMDEMKMRDPALAQEMERKRELEFEAREVAQAAMVKLAKINMEQAIQIATSQQPGKVLISSLGAKGWEEPGKLGKDGVVFYHVIVADEVNPGSTHIWVNAVDGTIMKTEKELPRKKREQ